MKRILYLLPLVLLAACHGGAPLKTEVREYADSSAHAYLTMHTELPVPAGRAASAIRSTLIDVMDGQLSQISYGETERYFPRFTGRTDDTEALLSYYEGQTMAQIAKLSQDDADERESYVRENEDMSEEEKEDLLSNMPAWGYDFNLKKVADTLGYVVFLSENYIYMGGAHGGVTGSGHLTFDRKSGRLIDPMVDPDCVAEIQPLLMNGLQEYYSDAGEEMSGEEVKGRLQIDGDVIPLPAWTPYPTADGLAFVYQQYEIASYADGMPSFTIPFEDIKPWLTPQAKALLGMR